MVHMSHRSVFRELPPVVQEELTKQYAVQRLGPGETLHRRGETTDRVWIVVKGRVQGVIPTKVGSGRVQVLCQTLAGGLVGACCAWGKGRIFQCDAAAQESLEVISVPIGIFEGLVRDHAEFRQAVTRDLVSRLNACMSQTVERHQAVEARLIKVMGRLLKEHGRIIPLTRRELAQLASTTVETTIRTVRKWERQGWVALFWGGIRIRRLQPFSLDRSRS